MYYIGIDATGHFARLVAADEDMRVIGKHTGHLGETNKSEHFTKLLYEFNRMTNTLLDNCAGLCVGAAKEDVPAFEEMLRALAYAFPATVIREEMMTVAAHTNGGAGIAVFSAAKAWGAFVDGEGKFTVIGDYPKPIDDGASAYSMGLAALKAVFLSIDGRVESTALTGAVIDYLKLPSPFKLRSAAGKLNDAMIAEIGLLVKYASANGDNTALNIESDTAVSLAQAATALIEQSGIAEPSVCMTGSVFVTNENIQKIFTRFVTGKYKNADVRLMKEKPEMGALYIASKNKVNP